MVSGPFPLEGEGSGILSTLGVSLLNFQGVSMVHDPLLLEGEGSATSTLGVHSL